jgi:hypothetical protein
MNAGALAVLIASVLLLTQSAITIYIYSKNNIKSNNNYYASIALLVISILALILSGLGLGSTANVGTLGVLFVSILLITQSAITIYTYNKNNITKESKYNFSIATLVMAIVGFILCSIILMKRNGGGGSVATSGRDLLPTVDPVKLAASGTPENVEKLMTVIQTNGARVKAKVDQEIMEKQRALQALLETIQSRTQGVTEAAAALKVA